jgi:hypothetical protein
MIAFTVFLALVVIIVSIFTVLIGGPKEDRWPDAWGPKPEEASWQRPTDEAGLVHTDDLRP